MPNNNAPHIERLMDFIRIPTVATPADYEKVPDSIKKGRSQVETFQRAFDFLHSWLSEFADDVGSQVVELNKSEGFSARNLWGLVKGQDSTRAVMLQGHYDVVKEEANFAPEIRDGRLYGRGATDMKGAVAVAIQTLENMRRQGNRPALDTYVLFTCEEEVAARGSFAFSENPPPWVEKVDFAICMESAYHMDADFLEFGIRHPGIATVEFNVPLLAATIEGTWWRMRVDPGPAVIAALGPGQNKIPKHASLQPETLDPNAVMLAILKALPDYSVAEFHSNKDIKGASNTTAKFAECLLCTPQEREMLEGIIQTQTLRYLDQVQDQELAALLKVSSFVHLEPAEAQKSFDASQFVNGILSFRHNVKDEYTNSRFGHPPINIAIVSIRDGQAKAKIDIRTDAALQANLDRVLEKHFANPDHYKILWNDPSLENPQIATNKHLLQLRDICQKYTTVEALGAQTGWTEASVWTHRLNIPTVVVGPGSLKMAHTPSEYVRLDHLSQMMAILEEFLLTTK
jgi:acetylornithine deacetylase/succinyl-diaminopimelate desuccinylase-like protein